MKKKTKSPPLQRVSDQLREFLFTVPNLTNFAEEIGMSVGNLSKFRRGLGRSLSLDSVDTIAQALGLRLVRIETAGDEPKGDE